MRGWVIILKKDGVDFVILFVSVCFKKNVFKSCFVVGIIGEWKIVFWLNGNIFVFGLFVKNELNVIYIYIDEIIKLD